MAAKPAGAAGAKAQAASTFGPIVPGLCASSRGDARRSGRSRSGQST